jgi:hypothetical protein
LKSKSANSGHQHLKGQPLLHLTGMQNEAESGPANKTNSLHWNWNRSQVSGMPFHSYGYTLTSGPFAFISSYLGKLACVIVLKCGQDGCRR